MNRKENLLLLVASTFVVAALTVGLISEMGLAIYVPSVLLTAFSFLFLPVRLFILGVSQVRKWRKGKVERDG